MTTRENTPDYISEQLGTLAGKPLSEREIDVVLAIMAGKTVVREIAAAIGTTETTVNNYLHYIYRKAGVPNMSAVILMVAGITPCGPALSEARRRWRRQYYQSAAGATVRLRRDRFEP